MESTAGIQVQAHFLQCLAIDNTEGRVAGGDVSGRILIWHNLKAGLATAAEGKEAKLSNTTVHWHSRAVQCLTFSLDSAYLLSGGSEAVLVSPNPLPPFLYSCLPLC